MADLTRYRMTRAAFDIISVFGSLGAKAVPGPVFVSMLSARGYSESSVRNQLARLSHRRLLTSTRSGRTTVYRRGHSVEKTYATVAGGSAPPPWAGSFAALLVTVPESRRSDRDRILYSARFLGYRPLRAGVLIGFEDASAMLAEMLHPLAPDSAAGIEACRLTPVDPTQGRAWVRRAFRLPDLAAEIAALQRRADDAAKAPELSESAYFDLFHEASMLALRQPSIPAEMLTDQQTSGARVQALVKQIAGLWGARLAQPAFVRTSAVPAASLIEFDPAFWDSIGLPVPDLSPPAGERPAQP